MPSVIAYSGALVKSSSLCSRFSRGKRVKGAFSFIMSENASNYDHKKIESKWQNFWEKNETFKTPIRDKKRPKKYILDMFPYPSGAGLHVGHPEGYTASDILTRFYRMKGFDVLHPMGWDSFGLPAEQHAIQTGTHPSTTTYKNIKIFKRQLKSLGFSYDWSKEIATTDEDYVKWTQWIFLQLFKSNLAEQSEALVNWCPALGTVLANEEVIDGKSERGGHPITRQPLRQWVLKITLYADKLLDGLKGLKWPEGTLQAQKQWIGKSEGCQISFELPDEADEAIEVFTSRPDTLMGVTYLVLAPEHPLVKKLVSAERKDEVERYVAVSAEKSDLSRTTAGSVGKTKTGVNLGAFAIHPISNEKISIWVSDYVVWGYASGAVMAVPAHDQRDFEFAKTFDLPIKRVVAESKNDKNSELSEAFVEYGTAVNSGPFNGLKSEECKKEVIENLEKSGKGKATVNYKLRDWIFSRQRYWGEPIPIYFPVIMKNEQGDPRNDDEHTICYDQPIPLPEDELPLVLPEMESFEPGNDPAGCLARAKSWRYFKKDEKWFARETNTMPQWAGSCWYYLRFCDTSNDKEFVSKEKDEEWLPVDMYIGGQEHAVLHLLYARFWHKFLHDKGFVKDKEPFEGLVHQGMILGSDGEKMSKSRGNIVNPDDIVNEFGADSLRLYEMFMGPLEASKPWQTSQIAGVVRFRNKVHSVCLLSSQNKEDFPLQKDTEILLHKTTKKVTEDIESLSFNTAISALMVYCNHLNAQGSNLSKKSVETLILLVSPFAPHLAEECWEMIGNKSALAKFDWPDFSEELCEDEKVWIGVQVNGKKVGEVEIDKAADERTAKDLAVKQPRVAERIKSMEVKKFIYVPGRIINLVVAGKK